MNWLCDLILWWLCTLFLALPSALILLALALVLSGVFALGYFACVLTSLTPHPGPLPVEGRGRREGELRP